MKKQDIMLIAGLVIIFLISIFALQGTKANKVELPLALTGSEKELTKIDYTTYEEKINNGENFLIIIERKGCGYCEKYMPIVTEVASEKEIPIYYIDTADLSSEEFTKLENSNLYLKREQWGTPTTLLLSGNSVAASLGGYVEKDEFVEFIEKNIKLENASE